MDKSRQQFETWVQDNAYLFMHINLTYHEAALYKLWQASRESLEVELPYINTDPDYADAYTNGKGDGILEVAAILNELGVTLK